MSRKKGFTLIEIVIVIVLIGILAAAIGPRILHLQDSFKVEAAAEQIANHIRLAQSLAIARHDDHRVYFDTANHAYSVYNVDTGDTVKNPLNPGKDLIVDFKNPDSEYYDSQLKGVTIESLSPANYSATFNPLGKPTAGRGSVTITKGSSTRYIGVAAETGAVSIWE